MKLTKELVLGSQSPRRAQFLKDLGLAFTALPLDLDETAPAHLSPAETATFVSELKAASTLLGRKDEVRRETNNGIKRFINSTAQKG